MRFEWDDAKEAINIQKHGVDFDEAAETFSDPLSRAMKKEYDFSKAKRGVLRQLPPEEERARHTKVRITILLDQDILKVFKSRAAKPGAEPYQTQINRALREHVSSTAPTPKDELLNDEGFIARVSERVAEYPTRRGQNASRQRSRRG